MVIKLSTTLRLPQTMRIAPFKPVRRQEPKCSYLSVLKKTNTRQTDRETICTGAELVVYASCCLAPVNCFWLLSVKVPQSFQKGGLMTEKPWTLIFVPLKTDGIVWNVQFHLLSSKQQSFIQGWFLPELGQTSVKMGRSGGGRPRLVHGWSCHIGKLMILNDFEIF